jgi:hypothetical protein
MTKTKTSWITGPTIISTIPILLGLAFSIPAVKTVMKAKESEGWPIAQATIVSSEVEFSRSSSRSVSKSPNVVYEYYVNKELRSGGRILFGVLNFFGNKTDECLEKYKKGAKVIIYYNPDDPDETVLEPGIHMTTWVYCIYAFVPILFGSLFIWVIIYTGVK